MLYKPDKSLIASMENADTKEVNFNNEKAKNQKKEVKPSKD